MRIGAISDIHIDINENYPLQDILSETINRNKLDLLLIAGDISNNYQVSIQFVEKLKSNSGVPVYFVPGNHDLWDLENKIDDTWKIYETFSEHPDCLCGKIIELDDWSIIGNPGWYDYSKGNKTYNIEDFDKKTINRRVWQDSINVKWNKTDNEVHNIMLQNLEKQLLSCNGKNIITVTHMLTLPEFKVPESWQNWDYFNAFLGSKDYGELFKNFNVKYSIMGHVHFRKQLIKNKIDYRCVCLGYHKEWKNKDVYSEVQDALSIIDTESSI
ncbi:MAG: metallophosphoesterase [Spirochaetales bacterium]|nr:metallophosphoesterase [Spirochaetales bacterium]